MGNFLNVYDRAYDNEICISLCASCHLSCLQKPGGTITTVDGYGRNVPSFFWVESTKVCTHLSFFGNNFFN